MGSLGEPPKKSRHPPVRSFFFLATSSALGRSLRCSSALVVQGPGDGHDHGGRHALSKSGSKRRQTARARGSHGGLHGRFTCSHMDVTALSSTSTQPLNYQNSPRASSENPASPPNYEKPEPSRGQGGQVKALRRGSEARTQIM